MTEAVISTAGRGLLDDDGVKDWRQLSSFEY